MKKLTLIVAFVGMTMLQACSNNTDTATVDNTVYPQVYEIRNANFGLDPNEGYLIRQDFPASLEVLQQDVVLMYRLSGTVDSNTPIWQQIPRTLYLPEGELDYDFDFTKNDFSIYAGGTYDLALTPTYINNETFRIVIIPTVYVNKVAVQGTKALDYSNYEEVIKALKIDIKQVKVLN
jgi:hypothetical protein